ncbi:hypothetical protein, partial [Mycoplasmopsis cricetuli]|uniref:hypothetical protein n=1 Tax=Mycoplasmopsis cricetuli TaxID=171283 RepID=UPI0005681F2B
TTSETPYVFSKISSSSTKITYSLEIPHSNTEFSLTNNEKLFLEFNAIYNDGSNDQTQMLSTESKTGTTAEKSTEYTYKYQIDFDFTIPESLKDKQFTLQFVSLKKGTEKASATSINITSSNAEVRA